MQHIVRCRESRRMLRLMKSAWKRIRLFSSITRIIIITLGARSICCCNSIVCIFTLSIRCVLLHIKQNGRCFFLFFVFWRPQIHANFAIQNSSKSTRRSSKTNLNISRPETNIFLIFNERSTKFAGYID